MSTPDIAALAAGHGVIVPPGAALPVGRWTRWGTVDRPRSKNGAVLLTDGGRVIVQNHASGAPPVSIRIGGDTVSNDPVHAIARAARAKRNAEIEQRYADVADRARQQWSTLRPADPNHPYLRAKGVGPHMLRQDGNRLVVPLTRDGQLTSLQFIGPALGQRKLFLTGGRKGGSYLPLGGLPTTTLYICEGFATAATVHAATGHTAVMGMDAGNLPKVASHLRRMFPGIAIVLAADNEPSGIKHANTAARAVHGHVVMPPQPGTDWNDHAARHGLAAVLRAFLRFLP